MNITKLKKIEKIPIESEPSSKIKVYIIATSNIRKIFNLQPKFYQLLNNYSSDLIFVKVAKIFTSKWGRNDIVNEDEDNELRSKFKILEPKSIYEFKKIVECKNLIVIVNFSEKWNDWYLWYYLRKYFIPIIYIFPLSTIVSFPPKVVLGNSLFDRIVRRLKGLGKNAIEVLVKRYLIRLDTTFVSDKINYDKMKKDIKYNETILINSSFYDSILLSDYEITNEYIVFIDSMLPYHGDQIKYGYESIDRQLYYRSLKKILDKVELLLGKEVVVCLHPKFNDKYLCRDFGKRKAFKYRTDEFVAKAELVLFHESSAINSAIVYGKKVVQLTGAKFNNFVRKCCEAYQTLIPFKTIDIFEWREDYVKETITKVKVDWEQYNSFLANYIIASGQKDLPSCAQIVDHLNRKYFISNSEEK
jgi:hypothetical protein